MGQLTLAKTMADNPSAYSISQLQGAYAYLAKLRTNGGVRNSERASDRLERRLASLNDELRRRGAVFYIETSIGTALGINCR